MTFYDLILTGFFSGLGSTVANYFMMEFFFKRWERERVLRKKPPRKKS